MGALNPVITVIGLSHLTELKVELGKLNFHKFRHTFRDAINAMCPSNYGVEDEEHFLLLRLSFCSQRRIPLDSVYFLLRPLGKDPHVLFQRPFGFTNPSNEPVTKILLHGCNDLPFAANRETLEGSLWYVKEVRRFI